MPIIPDNTDSEKFELETPCYIIDSIHLEKNVNDLIAEFTSGWGYDVLFGYSVKTNSLPWIITYMKSRGFYAEVVSEQEYRLARELGFSDDKIILNGPVKSEPLLLSALNGGSIVNIDNITEIEKLENICHKAKKEWKIGLRYSFRLDKSCPNETIVGDRQSRFGFCVENGELKSAIERIKSIGSIKINGLHGHNSTKTKSLSIFRAISGMARNIIDEYGLDIEYFDVGGGFFGDKIGAPSFREYVDIISDAFGKHEGIALIAEPGASLVSSPISYLCSIVSTKKAMDKRFVTLDGSNVHIDPLMHGIGFAKKELYRCLNKEREAVGLQEICGFTCIEMDRMGVYNNKPEFVPGDRIEFLNCGSYSMALSSLFISYYPRVYMQDASGFHMVRAEWDEKEYMAKNEVF